MKLTVILLFLSGFAPLASAIYELCVALKANRYKDMGLLSFTYANGDFVENLCIFTEPAYRYYEIDIKKVTQSSMDLSQASPLDMMVNRDYKEAFLPVKDLKHKGTYWFYFYDDGNSKRPFLIVTEKGTRTGSFVRKNHMNTIIEVTKPEGDPLPDFTLASVARNISKDLTGYVISDSTRFPGFLILSEFKVAWEGSKVTGLPPAQGQTDDRPGFFLQVANNPDEVFLVPSSGNQPDPNAQLLRSVPRSFLYDKKHLVLLDTANGCVHIIVDFGNFSVTAGISRTFKRENLPFEAYFKCGKPIEDPNPNRCKVVKGSHPGITSEGGDDSFSMAFPTVIVALVVAVLAVGLIYACLPKKKGKGGTKRKAAGKSSTSSSAISGRSKRSRKSKVGKSKTTAK